MRKLSIVLSIMVPAMVLLSACAGNASSTDVPATSPVETEVISTPNVVSTATEAAGSETTTPEATDAVESPTAAVPVTGKPNAMRLSEQLDFTVSDESGAQVGEVDDIVIDLGNAMVGYVIVSTGDKQVAVPWDQLNMADEQTGSFALQAEDDMFTNAPAFDLSTLPAIGEAANDWDAELRSYWKGSAGGAQPAPGSANRGQPQGVILASQVLAADLSLQGQTALQAEIEDLIVNTKSGKIQFVVVKTNLDNTERWIPVPLALFNWDPTTQGFNLNLDMSVLQEALPALEAQFPDTSVEGWEQEWITFWQNHGVNMTP